MAYTREEHQQASAKIPRDPHGHFSGKESNSSSPSKPSDPSRLAFLKNIFPTGTNLEKATDEDTLIDVHVGNPLKRIIDLLQDIKRQKAFSFNLKGSLGMAGVVLVITGMGVFGGTQAFCDKGSQSHFGTIKILQVQEEIQESSIPLLSQIPLISHITQIVLPGKTITGNLVVLFKQDTTIIRLVQPKNIAVSNLINQPIIATGNYNSCSQTLTLRDSSSIELFK